MQRNKHIKTFQEELTVEFRAIILKSIGKLHRTEHHP
jgi:hypothetical protein